MDPEEGALACGTQGVGRLADTEVILESVLMRLYSKDLADEPILVTAGCTEEAIDPVRFISNPSSGKMGFALAKAAAQRGASVTLGASCVFGVTSLQAKITNNIVVSINVSVVLRFIRSSKLEELYSLHNVYLTSCCSQWRNMG